MTKLLSTEYITVSLIAFACTVFPLFFGGVHPPVYLTMFILLGATAYLSSRQLEVMPTQDRWVWSLFLYLLVVGVIGFIWRTTHPVVGSISSHLDSRHYVRSILSLAGFLAAYRIAQISLIRRWLSTRSLIKLLSLAGFVVSFTALLHWFYDNGRLFWVFEPDNIFVSQRARWPFVSANSLGQFLLLCVFPALYLLVEDFRGLLHAHAVLAARRPVSALDMFNAPGVQWLLIRLMIHSICVSCIGIGLLACQSRNAWLAFSITFILYIVFFRIIHKHSHIDIDKLYSERRKTRPLEDITFFDTVFSVIRRFALPVAIGIAALLLFLFIRDQGLELISNRAYFGLLSSVDDIRWQMYSDSIPIFISHPILGVGLGGWPVAFESYASPLLAQLSPGYLHSDLFQFVLETGLVGAILLTLWLKEIVQRAFLRAKTADNRVKDELLVFGLSLMALGITSCTDFPFRIPAISIVASIVLGALSFKTLIPSSKTPVPNDV